MELKNKKKEQEELNNSSFFAYAEYTLLSDYMIFLLKYYYEFENPNIFKDKNYTYVKEKTNKYMLYKVENILEFNEIIKLLALEKNNFDRIVTTKENNSYIYYKNNTYALIEITEEDREYKNVITNKLRISKGNIYNQLNRSNWYFLWSNKVDYFKGIKKEIIDPKCNEMLDYYVGMAESAIQYFNTEISTEKQKDNLYISHKRIDNNIKNPINIVIDRKERDIAEYIKYLILTNKYSEKAVVILLEKISKENLTLELIFARVLFPTYYFDMCEECLFENNSKKITVEQISNYEKLIKNFYNMLNKIKKIKKIDWL